MMQEKLLATLHSAQSHQCGLKDRFLLIRGKLDAIEQKESNVDVVNKVLIPLLLSWNPDLLMRSLKKLDGADNFMVGKTKRY